MAQWKAVLEFVAHAVTLPITASVSAAHIPRRRTVGQRLDLSATPTLEIDRLAVLVHVLPPVTNGHTHELLEVHGAHCAPRRQVARPSNDLWVTRGRG